MIKPNYTYSFAGVYSSTNWPPFTVYLKLSFETQSLKPKNKKVIKTVWTTWSEPYLFFSYFNGVKSSYRKKIYSPENETCVRGRYLFLTFFFWTKLQRQWSLCKTRPSTLASTEALNEDVRSKLVSGVLLLFDIGVKERTSSRNEVV